MILILGGTTEGRAAVRVVEQAGKTYYYSTKSNKQKIECVYGTRLTGGMNTNEMANFCREKEIKLLIDAAHPFAVLLHKNVAVVAEQLEIPVIRFERIYPEHNKQFIWCDDFDDAIRKLKAHPVRKLLALSGVNTIAPLRPYWENNDCLFRILNREESLQIAAKQGFPKEQLVFFNERKDNVLTSKEDHNSSQKNKNSENNPSKSKQYCDECIHQNNTDTEITGLIEQIRPDAILTKESGYSGSFEEKVNTALELNVSVFVIKRPSLPGSFTNVYGEIGLRIKTERLLPGFFALRMGFTTGVYATATAKAALTALLTKKDVNECIIRLPNSIANNAGEPVAIPVSSTERYNNKVRCTASKDAGDDPDITNKASIQAEVFFAEDQDDSLTEQAYNDEVFAIRTNKEQNSGDTCQDPHHAVDICLTDEEQNYKIILRRGKGIGIVRLPGLGINIGEPAINATPRRMILKELEEILNKYLIQDKKLIVTISVPEGEEIAKRTFNPKLGIEGGISIIGTSGIVRPFSNEAFIATIRKEMEIAKATGCRTIVINSGAKSERFLKEQYSELKPQAFIHYGNFIGETLKLASELQIPEVVMGIMIGKAVKLAEGALDTHSKKGTMNKTFIKSLASSAGCNEADLQKIDQLNLARELWNLFPEKEQIRFLAALINKCHEQRSLIYSYGKLTTLLIDEEGSIFT